MGDVLKHGNSLPIELVYQPRKGGRMGIVEDFAALRKAGERPDGSHRCDDYDEPDWVCECGHKNDPYQDCKKAKP